MNAALYDEAEGYYRRADRKRWGREGDYRTSPERSELFAATFARYFARLYDELQRPSEWTIVEVGPGGGHFATSMLRALQDSFSQVFGATRYVPIETNDELKALTPIHVGKGTPASLNVRITSANHRAVRPARSRGGRSVQLIVFVHEGRLPRSFL